MQHIKKFPYLAFIVAILFLTGMTFSSAFFTRLNLGTPTALGDEDEGESDDEKDEADNEDEEDHEDGDKEDDEESSEERRTKTQRTEVDEEDEDENDSEAEESDDEEEDVNDSQDEIQELNEDINKVESRISVLGANGADVASFRATLSEIKDLASQAQARLVSAPKEAETLIETADHKLERLSKLVKLTLGDDDENDDDEDAMEEIQDLTKDIAKLEVKLSALADRGVDVSSIRLSLDAAKELLIQAKEKAIAGDLAGAEALTEVADKKMETLKHAIELAYGDDDEEDEDEDEDEADEYKNEVAQFVHNLKEIGEIDGGIGQQVRVVAQSQNDSTSRVEKSIDEINDRSDFVKFLVGPKYGSIAEVENAISENQIRIKALSELASQVTDPVVKNILLDQVKSFQQENARLQSFITESASGFSLFGWLAKILS